MNTNVRFAAIFISVLILWFASGIFVSEPSAKKIISDRPLTEVQVTTSEQQLYRPEIALRALTEPNRMVNLVAQISGTISGSLATEGSNVKQGDIICQIAEEDRFLRLDQANATLKQAQISYDGALKLKTNGYQSELAISQAEAALETAKANMKRAQLNVEFLTITAPFDGIIESRPVEQGDYVTPGRACATLVELNPLKVTSMVNENEISKIQLSSMASAEVLGVGLVPAKINYLSYQADPMTRGYRLESKINNPDNTIRGGLTARLTVFTDGVSAHYIPASATLLNDQGKMAVRVLTTENIVRSIDVSVLGEEQDGLWVSGLPREITLVTVGQNYVIDGEPVKPVFLSDQSAK